MVSLMELEAKRNKFITSLSSFLSVATPQVVACIWISSKPLKDREKPFSWLNYLFNGVLESQVHHFSNTEKSIFKTEQFGKSMYLLQMQSNYSQIDKAYHDFIDVLKSEVKDTSKARILVISDQPQQFKNSIKKISRDFDHLEYLY